MQNVKAKAPDRISAQIDASLDRMMGRQVSGVWPGSPESAQADARRAAMVAQALGDDEANGAGCDAALRGEREIDIIRFACR